MIYSNQGSKLFLVYAFLIIMPELRPRIKVRCSLAAIFCKRLLVIDFYTLVSKLQTFRKILSDFSVQTQHWIPEIFEK